MDEHCFFKVASKFACRDHRMLCQHIIYAVVNKFAGWYRALGFVGASSHRGRRIAITGWARKISSVGGSLRDVQRLAGHSALGTTQRYIEGSEDAKRRVVELM